MKVVVTSAFMWMMASAMLPVMAESGDGSFKVVSWNVGHHSMGLKDRPTIPHGQDEVYLDMYKSFIRGARVVGICEYSAEFTTNKLMKSMLRSLMCLLRQDTRLPTGGS